MTDRLLIIFVKNPLPGKVKSRLAKTLGNKAALHIYLELLDHTRKITTALPLNKVVFFSDFLEADGFWEPSYEKQLQSGQDLGMRMELAFEWGFRMGNAQVCIIGSDCYELNGQIILQAFDVLDHKDVVLGPTYDGGYYLLGMKVLHRELFRKKKWSTDSVTSDTVKDLQQLRLTWDRLPTLHDVDVEADLPEALRARLP